MFKIRTLAISIVAILLTSVLSPALASEPTPLEVYPENYLTLDEAHMTSSDIVTSSILSAPENFQVIHATSFYASVAWQPPFYNDGSPVQGYLVRIYDSWGNSYQFETGGNYFSIGGMNEGSAYYYYIYAFNGEGYSPPLFGGLTTPPYYSAPTSVLNFTSGTPTESTVPLTWQIPTYSGAQIDNYNIEYSKDGLTWSEPIGVSSFYFNESFTVSGLKKGTDYTFRINASSVNGVSEYSYVNARTAGVPDSAPTVPLNLSVASTAYSAKASWSSPASDGGQPITDYILQYKSNSSLNWITVNDGINTNNSFTINGLTGSTSYNFRVAAINAIGQSIFTNVLIKPTASKTVPGAIIYPRITGGTATSMKLAWDISYNNGGSPITDYVIQYKRSTTSTWTTFNDGVTPNRFTTISNLVAGYTYNYRIAARNSVGNSPYTQGLIIMTQPLAPTSLAITSKDYSSVSFSFNHAVEANKALISDATIQYKITGTTIWTTFNDGVSTTPTITVTGLKQNTSYDFRVASISTYKTGAYSAIISTRTNAALPAMQPTELTTLSTTTTEVLLGWKAPASDGITDYIVRYSADGKAWTVFNDGVSSSTTAIVRGLIAGKQYYFQVATVAIGITSTYTSSYISSSDSPVSPPETPKSFIASNVSSYGFDLRWSAKASSASIITSYRIGVSKDGVNYVYTDISSKSQFAYLVPLTPKTKYWISISAYNGFYSTPAITTATTL